VSNITPFIPLASLGSMRNLSNFIESTKNIISAYPGISSWEENEWDLSGVVSWKGRGKGRIAAIFSDFGTSNTSKVNYMSKPFSDFSKAYFVYQQAMRPIKNFSKRLVALRVIEKSLGHSGCTPNITELSPLLMNFAENLIMNRYSTVTAYHVGRELTYLVEFLCDMHLLATPFQWVSSIPHPVSDMDRVGLGGDLARESKLPSKAALEALPKCFLLACSLPDIVISSIAALLCVAPSRINEIFSINADCEVERSENNSTFYGIRWQSSKGYDPTIKWIPPTMVDVAKEALSRLRAVSEAARSVAKWYEDNPNQLFLDSDMEYSRTKGTLSLDEVSSILGLKKRGSAREWLVRHNVEISGHPTNKHKYYVKFTDFELAVIQSLPPDFPIIDQESGLKYSQALIVYRVNEMNPERGTIKCLVEPLGTTKFNNGLGAGSDAGRSSLFSRLGFTEPDGNPIQVKSHQFRHWINTLAHKDGVSQLDIAKWSGRKDIKQNAAYNHMTGMELMEMTRQIMNDDEKLYGDLAQFAAKTPVTRDEFLELEFPTAHVTEIGFCVHDYTMLPCSKFRDCINCSEHVCIKGDSIKTDRIRGQLILAEELLNRAEGARSEAIYGSDRWYERHLLTVDRLRSLLTVLLDPAVPIGAIIRLLPSNEYSAIQMAANDRAHDLSHCFVPSLPTLSSPSNEVRNATPSR
jgi:hypothetical protein